MSEWMNLIEETVSHFEEGARSVRAYTNETTYIITKERDADGYIVTTEEPGFPKNKTATLDQYFEKVFGIEARY
jgi:hypothetical protein